MSGLRIRVELPTAASTAGAYRVAAALRDTSMEDVEHPTVAETRADVAADDAAELYLPVQAQDLDPRNRYSLWVHVSSGDLERLAPGDYITTTAIPVGVSDVEQDREIVVALQRI